MRQVSNSLRQPFAMRIVNEFYRTDLIITIDNEPYKDKKKNQETIYIYIYDLTLSLFEHNDFHLSIWKEL